MNLEQKNGVALISGASSGIGANYAERRAISQAFGNSVPAPRHATGVRTAKK